MKKIILLFTAISFFVSSIFAQCDEVKSLSKMAKKSDYHKTLEKAKIIARKDTKNAYPYYFITQLTVSEFSQTHKVKYLNQALAYAVRAKNRDKKEACSSVFAPTLDSLKKRATDRADSLYSTKNKEDAVFYYDYIAKIYGDTTDNYRSLLMPATQNINTTKTQAQRDLAKFSKEELQNLNKTNSQRQKTGLWIKFYDNGQPAYIVFFKNGKPFGNYWRYHENGARKAHLNYDAQGYASAELYNQDTSLLAKGFYLGRNRDSIWNYFYPNDNIAAEYNYKKGQKNGRSKIFYPDKQILEILDWKNDKKEGLWRQFYPNGKVRMEARYKNNQKNGLFYLYYQNGSYDTKGHYVKGLRDGIWTYYDDGNHLKKKEIYKNGKLPIELEIDSLEIELRLQEQVFKLSKEQKKSVEDLQKVNSKIRKIKAQLAKLEVQSPDEKENQELEYLDKKLPASEDPMNYINNPQEFFRKQNK